MKWGFQMNINQEISAELLKMQDINYRDFQSKLIPTICADRIIGIRTPLLRKYSKKIYQNKNIDTFLKTLPHYYYEENNLHAFCIEQEKDFDKCISMLNNFLPYTDNWATCDSMCPKILAKHKDKLIRQIEIWLKSKDIYTVRFGLKSLMTHFLDDDFKPEYLSLAAAVKSDEYYIKMMIAWFYATALAKNYIPDGICVNAVKHSLGKCKNRLYGIFFKARHKIAADQGLRRELREFFQRATLAFGIFLPGHQKAE